MDDAGPTEVEAIGELKGGRPGETLRRSEPSAHDPICRSASPTGGGTHLALLLLCLHPHLILVHVLVFQLIVQLPAVVRLKHQGVTLWPSWRKNVIVNEI